MAAAVIAKAAGAPAAAGASAALVARPFPP